jgi:hypothetical protein
VWELALESVRSAASVSVSEWDDDKEVDTEVETTNTVAVPADTAGDCQEDHAICSNRNFLPTTSRRHPESKSIGSIDNSTDLPLR